ncbi:D-tagatose-1,6-bisphosphate aldolase subunit [Thalictrum thalictroides]|uniref:D-tagatose-1,6-bisphosphate aldolase subunit n=1 Tax=Thalictrum thalictroides TaxID=46969 RepID=A0A7J6XG31_THATH|nr:D-tagatose-1,6-bisphosphate aldolase subunit [Thalictrum thalictroides]
MAESSSALCSSAFSPFPTISRSKSSIKNSLFPTPGLFPSSKSSSSFFPGQSFRLVRSDAKGGPNDGGGSPFSDDSFGFYPWDSSLLDGDAAIQWVPEDRVTLFTTEGLVQIGGSVIPRRISSSDKQERSKISHRFQRQERDYMDPNQGLCLGALFDIAATNGLDMGRRLCIFGFCRSIEMLSDVVEDTVLEHGGEIVAAEKASKGGLQEKLTMTVAVPLLWGVPPASETLHLAVQSGGGIVEKVYWQWDFL